MSLKKLITRLSKKGSGRKAGSKRRSRSTKTAAKRKYRRDISERITRLSEADEIYLGELAQVFLNSETGVLVEAICNGLADQILSNLDDLNDTQAQIKLGQASAYRNVIKNIEKMVVKKEELLRPQDPIEEIETEVSEVPNPRMYSGMRGVI